MRGLARFFCLLCMLLLPSSLLHLTQAQPRQPWVATTDTHTAVVHADGTLWSWGMNSEGQLGDGSTTDRLIPAQVGRD
jgi:hypothetical protein